MLRTCLLAGVALIPMVWETAALSAESLHNAYFHPSNNVAAFSDVTPAILVSVNPTRTARPGWRFEARMLFGINVNSDFVLVRDATVTRDGQPARLFDLQPGDRLFIHRAEPDSPVVVRLEAVSQH